MHLCMYACTYVCTYVMYACARVLICAAVQGTSTRQGRASLLEQGNEQWRQCEWWRQRSNSSWVEPRTGHCGWSPARPSSGYHLWVPSPWLEATGNHGKSTRNRSTSDYYEHWGQPNGASANNICVSSFKAMSDCEHPQMRKGMLMLFEQTEFSLRVSGKVWKVDFWVVMGTQFHW